MKKALYPASFDPITYGHMNVIEQAENLFDEVILAVMQNPSKKEPLFTVKERLSMLNEIYKEHKNIKIVSGSGATIDLAELYACQALLRGLRGLDDFSYEHKLARINRKLSDKKISTICLFPDIEVEHISSSTVKELASLDKDISEYVHPLVKRKVKERIKIWK